MKYKLDKNFSPSFEDLCILYDLRELLMPYATKSINGFEPTKANELIDKLSQEFKEQCFLEDDWFGQKRHYKGLSHISSIGYHSKSTKRDVIAINALAYHCIKNYVRNGGKIEYLAQ